MLGRVLQRHWLVVTVGLYAVWKSCRQFGWETGVMMLLPVFTAVWLLPRLQNALERRMGYWPAFIVMVSVFIAPFIWLTIRWRF